MESAIKSYSPNSSSILRRTSSLILINGGREFQLAPRRVRGVVENLHFRRIMPPAPPFTRVSTPSMTAQPGGILSILYPRQPVVVLPSKRSFQPACRSASIRVLGGEAAN